jgi:hypothetical protein
MRSVGVLVAARAIGVGACAPRTFVLPAVAPTQALDSQEIWTATSASCRAMTGVRAALGLTGRVRDQRIPGLAGATLYAAVAADGSIGLEARVSGQLVFRLGGTSSNATLLVPSDNRVVRGVAEDIIDALVGLRLGPERLLAILGGCIARNADARHGERYGKVLRVETADAVVYLEPSGGVWGVRAGTAHGLAVEYRRQGGEVRDITFRSGPGATAGVSIVLHVKEIDRAPALAPALFAVVVPDDARPMTLQELRESGLIDDRSGTR